MARRRGCGCLSFILSFVLIIALLGGGVYFGGNYAIKRFLGDEGEFQKLGINNWGELFATIKGFNDMFDGKEPEGVQDSDRPSGENKTSAETKLANTIEGYDEGGSIFSGGLVFSGKLILTGGELAALMQSNMDAGDLDQVDDLGLGKMRIVRITIVSSGDVLDTDTENGLEIFPLLEIKITVAIQSNMIKDLVSQAPGGGFLAGMIKDGEMFITAENGLKIGANGDAELDESATSTLYVNDNTAIQGQILDTILSVTGQSKENVAKTLGESLASVLNSVGKVEFAKDSTEQNVVAFDNKYNSNLIIQINEIFKSVDIDTDYAEAATELKAIKSSFSEIKVQLANTLYDENSTPTLAAVESAINEVETEWDNFVLAYDIDDTTPTTDLEDKVNALKALVLPSV